MNIPDGMLLVDKPKFVSSFKVCSIIKSTLKAKKTGHCGTLDPLATGLLLILINGATKLQDKFMKCDKEYLTSFKLGIKTDSGDMDGKIIETKDFSFVDKNSLTKALNNFVGEIEQIPPMFSALKVDGQKLYNLARKGITIQRSPRKVNVQKIDFLYFADGVLNLLIKCSSGTYIRSIADDLGNSLGCGAVVTFLRRESIGSFNVSEAVDEKSFSNPEFLISKIIPQETLNEK
ncbi:MAG: tRNA pseudouridine(55) synthase TruB [Elusimicrobiota bacterium]|jgi:tRNA pseudouridine55 synthase|nr:tRNA pseudouridine(55) synthase TruB [Elusimicrobiota bacterium]